MAISPHATWTTQSEKLNGRPVYLVSQEYDYLQAKASTSYEFNQTGASGTADRTSINETETGRGSVICAQASADIMSDSSYGSGTNKTLTTKAAIPGSTTRYNYYASGCLITVKEDCYISSLVFRCKSTTGSNQQVYFEFRRATHNLSGNNPTTDFSIDSINAIGYVGIQFYITTSFAAYTMPVGQLTKGDYVFLFLPANPESSALTFKFETWNPNQTILNASSEFKGWDSNKITIGDFDCIYDGNWAGVQGGSITNFSFTSTSFDGLTILRDVNVMAYTTASTYTSPWLQVKDSSGSATTPTTPGQLRLDYIKPLNTSITFALYGDANGSDAGEVLIDASVVDGETVTDYYPYYKIVATLNTTDWFSTPELTSISVYFKLTNDYCKYDDSFVMTSGLPARPYVSQIPSYETTIDPITNRVSFSAPVIDYMIQRKGMSNAQSDIEALAQTYFLTGKELNIKIGWENVTSDNFINYQTGITDNQTYLNDNTLRIECKEIFFLTRDPYLYDAVTTFKPYYNYAHPADIMLSLLSYSGIPQRLIDTTSFGTMKTAVGANSVKDWLFYRPYTEEIKDIKKELDEISALTGWVSATLEDGKVYALNLLDSAGTLRATLTDQNSKELGKANIDLSKRVNLCSVQRGYWIEPSDMESKDIQYWDTTFDDESVRKVGRGEALKIANKWIPKDTYIGSETTNTLSKIVANRVTNTFKYGLWIVKRQTSLQFAYLQIGDQILLTGSQILYKGFYGENTVRGVIIGKKVNPSARNNEGEITFTIWLYQNLYGGLASVPAGNPTALTFGTAIDSQIADIAWVVNAEANPTGHVVLRRASYAPQSYPESGVTYEEDDPIGDATVEFVDAYTTLIFTDTSLTSDTEYHYAVYPYNNDGVPAKTNYKTSDPLRNSKWTKATEPGAQPTTIVFGAFDGTTTTTVKWTDSVTAPLAQYHLILRSTAATPDTNPSDVTAYPVGTTLGNATVVYNGNVAGSTGITDIGISFNGTTYYYSIYPYRGHDTNSLNYRVSATILTDDITTIIGEPTNQPTDLFAESTVTSEIDLSWEASDPVVTDYIVLFKKATSFTEVPVDANTYTTASTIGTCGVGYVGNLTSCTVTGLSSGSTYLLKVFAFNSSGGGSENYLTISPPAISMACA